MRFTSLIAAISLGISLGAAFPTGFDPRRDSMTASHAHEWPSSQQLDGSLHPYSPDTVDSALSKHDSMEYVSPQSHNHRVGGELTRGKRSQRRPLQKRGPKSGKSGKFDLYTSWYELRRFKPQLNALLEESLAYRGVKEVFHRERALLLRQALRLAMTTVDVSSKDPKLDCVNKMTCKEFCKSTGVFRLLCRTSPPSYRRLSVSSLRRMFRAANYRFGLPGAVCRMKYGKDCEKPQQLRAERLEKVEPLLKIVAQREMIKSETEAARFKGYEELVKMAQAELEKTVKEEHAKKVKEERAKKAQERHAKKVQEEQAKKAQEEQAKKAEAQEEQAKEAQEAQEEQDRKEVV